MTDGEEQPTEDHRGWAQVSQQTLEQTLTMLTEGTDPGDYSSPEQYAYEILKKKYRETAGESLAETYSRGEQ